MLLFPGFGLVEIVENRAAAGMAALQRSSLGMGTRGLLGWTDQ
jgi:hypothetical protein